MQIFLTSHTHSFSHTSSKRERGECARGFTLIELLICVGIIGIITAIVLLKYSSFDSTTLLKGAAYEVALALRETQVKSVSVLRSDTDVVNPNVGKFDYPYGVTFSPDRKSYTVFRFTDISSVAYPNNTPRYVSLDPEDFPTEDISVITLERSMQIQDVCVMVGNNENCDITRLDVSFRRPEFTALFYAEGVAPSDQDDITKGRIKLNSTKGTGVFVVEVSRLGQITVSLES